tara:strand:- start:1492 stop:2160 length:669 start_codon:yes stop_codon:yes gene_type:complete
MSGKRHSENFRPGRVPGHSDGRLYSPTFERNHQPVIAALLARLGTEPGAALEIGSGVGQHIQAFARALPHLRWQPSEPDPIHRNSIDAWSAFFGSNLPAAIALDASREFSTEIAQLAPLRLIFSMNVIHIAPYGVASSIITTAAHRLAPGGWLGFYGPFTEGGLHTGEGNANFDAGLRADNPAWGVRDVDELAALAIAAGLSQAELDVMPANNRILWFQQPA